MTAGVDPSLHFPIQQRIARRQTADRELQVAVADSVPFYQRFLQVYPDSAEAQNNLGVAFASLGRWSPLPFQKKAAAAFGQKATTAFS